MKHRSAFFTPRDVADGLAQLVPESATSILDPSAGVGDLLVSVVPRVSSAASFVCVEKSPTRLEKLAQNLRHLGTRVKIIQDDFLSWDATLPTCGLPYFDCITMNPPFSAKKGTWVSIPKLPQCAAFGKFLPARMPIEVAFVVKAISLLTTGGKLLSIVPCSIISGIGFQYVRDVLQRVGRISLVHELPPFSFRGIESTFYVLAFHNDQKTRHVNILNHSWHMPENLQWAHPKTLGVRLDFGYLRMRDRLSSLIRETPCLSWKPLQALAGITRGTISAPFDKRCVVHSSNFVNGFWQAPSGFDLRRNDHATHRLRFNDIAVTRVGRHAASTFGLFRSRRRWQFTDCVVRIRAHRCSQTVQILLALRALFSSSEFARLLERGTGATYLTSNDLGQIEIPTVLPISARRLLGCYEKAVRARDFQQMNTIEAEFRTKIMSR